MNHGSIVITYWNTSYFHQGTTTYVPMETALDFALATHATIILIGPYTHSDVDIKSVKVHNTVYVPPLFIGLLLEGYLHPVQA